MTRHTMNVKHAVVTGYAFFLLTGIGLAAQLQGAPDTALADILPSSTILCFQRPPKLITEETFKQTVLHGLYNEPGIAAFRSDLNRSHTRFINEVARTAELTPAFVRTLFEGQLSGAILDVSIAPVDSDSGVNLSFVFAFHLNTAPNQKMVFDAVKAAVEHYRKFMKTEVAIPAGLSVVNKEARIGNHDVLRVLGKRPLRFVVLGKTILFYQAARREALEQIIANYDNRLSAKSLARTALYKSTYRGAETRPGMGFFYINARRLYALLGALGKPEYMRLLDVLGISGVQGIGCAGGAYKEGLRHTMYFHAPNERNGLLDTLTMKEKAEQATLELPSDAPGILAARVNFAELYRKIPELVDSVEKTLSRQSQLGLANLAGKQNVLGVPAPEMLAPLGDAVIIHPGPCGWTLRFDMVQMKAFHAIIKRMEENIKRPFTSKSVSANNGKQHIIRYYNRSETPLPLAPAFCILNETPDGMGQVFFSSHPQAIEAILRHPVRGTLRDAPDLKRVMAGMGDRYTSFIYIDNRKSYRRVYDMITPVANLLTTNALYAIDPGKLPPGNVLGNYFFGCGLGIRNTPEGITFTGYSPFGMGALIVSLIDTPVVQGVLAGEAARYLGSLSNTDASQTAPTTPKAPAFLRPGQKKSDDSKLPGIGGE